MRIALYGFNTASGLGTMNRDIATCLGIERWIIPRHSKFPTLPPVDGVECRHITGRTISPQTIGDCLRGIDVLLFCETVRYVEHLPEVARKLKVKVVCVPMVENLNMHASWVSHVDTWLAPTAFSFSQLAMMGVRGKLKFCPWPIDTRKFTYRKRETCQRFIYAQGNGGRNDRKGGLIVAHAAHMAPEIPITVYSQVGDNYTSGANHVPVTWPNTVDLRGSVSEPRKLYHDGDVFIMPSRFDGLGLQMLECQAAGMPLIATDAPPMNEHHPWRRLVCSPERIQLANYGYASWNVSPQTLVDAMRDAIGSDISEASEASRRWVVENRDWQSMAEKIRAMIAE